MASFNVGQSGQAFTLNLTSQEPLITVGGGTITIQGIVGTYELIFSATAPLTFGDPPVETIANLDGVAFLVVPSNFTSFTLQVTISAQTTNPASSVPYTIPLTINTTQGPFDPSIVIDPPPPG